MPGISDDEEDDFFDAVDEQTEEFKVCLPPDKTHRYCISVQNHMIFLYETYRYL